MGHLQTLVMCGSWLKSKKTGEYVLYKVRDPKYKLVFEPMNYKKNTPLKPDTEPSYVRQLSYNVPPSYKLVDKPHSYP